MSLVSFGCCVLLAVSLTGWCRWLVGGAFTCVYCWYFSLFVRNWCSPCFRPFSITEIAFMERKDFLRVQFLQKKKPDSYTAGYIGSILKNVHPSRRSFYLCDAFLCWRQAIMAARTFKATSSRRCQYCTSEHSKNVSAAYWPHFP